VSTQQTLTLTPANDGRRRPETLLLCETCGEHVLRSRRHDHPHDLTDADTVTEAQRKKLEERVPDEAKVETQTYKITFHYECVETVTVEAANKSEAKAAAERRQTYDGEILDTIHTERRALGDKSVATLDYLEEYNLLPDDHDVTREDIMELVGDD
jgi:hypothetical protein